MHFKMLSAICFSLDQSKILSGQKLIPTMPYAPKYHIICNIESSNAKSSNGCIKSIVERTFTNVGGFQVTDGSCGHIGH